MSDQTISNLLPPQEDKLHDPAATGAAGAKLGDAMVPGFQAEFDPPEADLAGAFAESALSEADALASTHDTLLSQLVAARLA